MSSSLNHCVKNDVSQGTLCETQRLTSRKSRLRTPVSRHLKGFETPTTRPSSLMHLFGGICRNPRCGPHAACRGDGVALYLERNAPYMDYATYLACGWPIATGVIEGACRHLVKDRCELSGMRWTIDGAEALLHLRCIHENGDWDAFHAFRRRQRHQRLYAVPYPDDTATPLDLHALDPRAPIPPALAA